MLTILSVIEEVGEVPSGHLYAALMAHGMSLDKYTGVIDSLKRMGFLAESGYLLKVTESGHAILEAKKLATN